VCGVIKNGRLADRYTNRLRFEKVAGKCGLLLAVQTRRVVRVAIAQGERRRVARRWQQGERERETGI
jgi:hypothetical protein